MDREKKIFLGGVALFLITGFGIVVAFAFAAIPGSFSDSGGFPAFGAADSGLGSVDFALISGSQGKNYITQGYGYTGFSFAAYPGRRHDGIDIAARYGAPVHSASDGIVIATGNQDNFCYKKGFGKFILIEDETRSKVLMYAHLGSFATSRGEKIKAGDMLGTVGATGFETGTHLHFSVFEAQGFAVADKNGCGPGPAGRDTNPLRYLDSVPKI